MGKSIIRWCFITGNELCGFVPDVIV